MNAPLAHIEDTRPVTRADCIGGPRPCPWVSCEHHALLALLSGEAGARIEDLDAVALVETMPSTCLLDVADANPDGLTLDEVGALLGVTRERIRQIEAVATVRVRKRAARVALTPETALDGAPDALDAARSRREGSHGGAARFVEERRGPTPAPSHLAHLPGPDTVAAGQDFWCGRIAAPMPTARCAARHVARTHVNASVGEKATYRDCAECPDGAALLARLGASAPSTPRRYLPVIATVHASETTMPPAPKKPSKPTSTNASTSGIANGCEGCGEAPPDHAAGCERAASEADPEAASATQCAVKGCTNPVGPARANTPKWGIDCCAADRKRGLGAIDAGRATAKTVVAYLSEGPHSTTKRRSNDTATAAGAETCTAKGCNAPRGGVRCTTPKGTEDLCPPDRRLAHSRAVSWGISEAAAAQTLRDGTTERPAGAVPSRRGERPAKPAKTKASKKSPAKPVVHTPSPSVAVPPTVDTDLRGALEGFVTRFAGCSEPRVREIVREELAALLGVKRA